MKKTIVIIFGIVGMILGVALGEMTTAIPALNWLAIGGEIGFKTPVTVDLDFIQFTFGLWGKISICGVLCMVALAFISKKVVDWLKL